MKTANIESIKEKKVKTPKVELVSYSMKMVIPTGNYANIQPEIIVKAGTVEQAHEFIAPHMNKLWKEYYMISERKLDTKPVAQTTASVSMPPPNKVESSPVSGVAFLKATQAVQSCLSLDALNLIATQIDKSVKLEKQEKLDLLMLVSNKRTELNAKTNPTKATPIK